MAYKIFKLLLIVLLFILTIAWSNSKGITNPEIAALKTTESPDTNEIVAESVSYFPGNSEMNFSYFSKFKNYKDYFFSNSYIKIKEAVAAAAPVSDPLPLPEVLEPSAEPPVFVVKEPVPVQVESVESVAAAAPVSDPLPAPEVREPSAEPPAFVEEPSLSTRTDPVMVASISHAIREASPSPLRSSALESSASAGSSDQEYRIGPEDLLQVSVWGEKELTGEYTVRPDGRISMPLLNDVEAAGLTPETLARTIADRLGAYLKEPHVSVIVAQANAPKIFLLGNVVRPGPYPIRQQVTLLQALSLAGGFTPFASPRRIKVIRPTGEGREILEVNYYKLLEGTEGSPYLLKPGDTVVVP